MPESWDAASPEYRMNIRVARIFGTRLHDYHEPALVVFALLP
ncbi:hypothetical protein MPQ_1594 [Methylovorus sp. MP688]|nr:hypothetical protein MPQ_1594 [Methylovorus sp. MP688]